MTTIAMLDPPDISVAARGPALMPALLEVGPFLADRSLAGIFGVRPLHGHFFIGDDEVLLSRTVGNARRIEAGIVRRDEVDEGQQDQWGFFPGGFPVVLGWSVGATYTRSIAAAVKEVGAFLDRGDLTRVLQVEMLDELFLRPGEMLLEDTDVRARTQTTSVVPLDPTLEAEAAIWRFTPEGVPVPRGVCQLSGVKH